MLNVHDVMKDVSHPSIVHAVYTYVDAISSFEKY